MPVTRGGWLVLSCCALLAGACGDDASSSGGGEGGSGGGAKRDAGPPADDAATTIKDAGKDAAAVTPAKDAGHDAMTQPGDAAVDAGHDSGADTGTPPDDDSGAGVDASADAGVDAAPPSCTPQECALLDTECAQGVCSAGTGLCELVPVNDGAACGSAGTACSLQDTCFGGACLPNHRQPGSACGDQGVVCRVDDACDGQGNCVDNGVTLGAPCGNTEETSCHDSDSCDASGNCASGTKPDGTGCGDLTDTTCNPLDTCSGGLCVTKVAPALTACGDGTDSTCDHPDSCDGLGGCAPNYEATGTLCGAQSSECHQADECDGNGACAATGIQPPGTPCGDPSSSECDAADSCDDNGDCAANQAATGTVCGTQSELCMNDDTCDASGVCQDNGVNPNCIVTASGAVRDLGGAPLADVTVDVANDATVAPAVSDAAGEFTLDVPILTTLLLRLAPPPGYWGSIVPRLVDPAVFVYLGSLELFDDATVAASVAAVGGVAPADTSKGIVVVDFEGAAGGETASISAPSEPGIASDGTGALQLSNAVLSPQSPSVVFVNATIGTTTVSVTGAPGLTQCVAAFSDLSDWPVAAHSFTRPQFICTAQ